MANAFRSFLEKIGLVAPQKATEPTASASMAPSMPKPSTPAPEAPAAPAMMQDAAPQTEEPAPAASVTCDAEHMNCTSEPKGCCDLNAQHDGMAHECSACKQTF